MIFDEMNSNATLRSCFIWTLLGAALFLQACEKKPPEFVPREAKVKESVVHFDDMRSEPKYVNIKKRDRFSKDAIERRRIMREKARGVFHRQSRWDP